MATPFPQVPRRLNLPREFPKTPEDSVPYIKTLVQAINQQNDQISSVVSGMENADVDANKPAAGIRGRLYLSTDFTPERGNIDDGTAWQQWTLNVFELGSVTISGAVTTGTYTFANTQPNTSFKVSATPVLSTGAPAAGSNRVLSIAKTTAHVVVTVEVAPGVGNTVTFDLIIAR